jgi:hypothetical protein
LGSEAFLVLALAGGIAGLALVRFADLDILK